MCGTFAEAQNALREQMARELEPPRPSKQATELRLQASTRSRLRRNFRTRARHSDPAAAASAGRNNDASNWKKHWRGRIGAERLEQYAARIETVQQQAIGGFQSQLDDVLSLHRNELHRQSENLFEEIHARIRSSFEAANSEALEKFDAAGALPGAAALHQDGRGGSPAGGRASLLDAAMTMQQDRIREFRGRGLRGIAGALPRKSGHAWNSC